MLCQCVESPTAGSVPVILDWCLECAAEGVPLLPIGVLADVGHLVFGGEGIPVEDSLRKQLGELFPLASTRLRQYEDLFLGKLYGDRSFDRAVDGLRRYADRRDRAKGLAFLMQQMGQRAGYPGVHLSPAVIRNLQRLDGAELLQKAVESLQEHGPLWLEDIDIALAEETPEHPPTLLEQLYQEASLALRNLGEVLAYEDVFELEHGTAIAGFGQRIALRQVLKAAGELGNRVPHQPVRPLNRRHQVSTKIVDEDTYPIGGFSSISNRGSIESLLHSQLAFMETDERPDMFDIKFLRDELLYYSRDENQFLRRRRSFVLALFPDLSETRFKDANLPWQRIVLLLGMCVLAVERLTDWLSEDALRFEFVFLKPAGKKSGAAKRLDQERELLEILFREQIANQTVVLVDVDSREALADRCEQLSRRSLCNLLLLSAKDRTVDAENVLQSGLRVDAAVPAFSIDESEFHRFESGPAPLDAWAATLVRLLEAWVAG